MILLPTPGHTAGSMSMLIRQEGWEPILLVGDLTYEAALLEKDIVPGTGDKDALLASFAQPGMCGDLVAQQLSHRGCRGTEAATDSELVSILSQAQGRFRQYERC